MPGNLPPLEGDFYNRANQGATADESRGISVSAYYCGHHRDLRGDRFHDGTLKSG